MARISLDPPRNPVVRVARWYSRRRYGRTMEPLMAMGHHPRALLTGSLFELGVARWKALDPGLKHLAVMVSAARIGCSWCLDFGHWEARELGLPMEKVRYAPVWREHRDLFSDLEQRVMEYAEAMTETEPAVTDEMARGLVRRLGEKAFVELTMMVAVENLRSRINSAFGLVGQGFSDECEVPPLPSARPPAGPGAQPGPGVTKPLS